jgi:prepilin-type N-terminal cleavage/methylation domain-containing protein
VNRPVAAVGARQQGFTLIEIAVGMAVLGLCVTAALQTFGGGIQLAKASSRRTEAVMHAKALMDASLWSPELINEVSHGEIGNGYRWERRIRDARADEGFDDEAEVDVRLAVVSVKVEWDEPQGVKVYRVATMRVQPEYED